MRFLPAALLCIALAATTALADPTFRVTYPNGVARVEIDGDWRHSRYAVWRASAETGPYDAITAAEVLCLGACFADDHTGVGGRTYFYRFDVVTPDGGLVSFGPYAAKLSEEQIRPVRASISPNPGRGATRIAVFVTGPPDQVQGAEVAMFDLQGRRQRQLHHGPLSAGSIRLDWDGRDDRGRDLGAGVYLLRVVTWDGRRHVSRVVRSR